MGSESRKDQMLFFFWGTGKRVSDCVEETCKVSTRMSPALIKVMLPRGQQVPGSKNLRERKLNHGGPEGLWLSLQPGWVKMMPSEIVCPQHCISPHSYSGSSANRLSLQHPLVGRKLPVCSVATLWFYAIGYGLVGKRGSL